MPVRGSHGTRYEVECWHIDGNVRWYEADGSLGGRLCCHPHGADPQGGRIPLHDLVAGQILALRADEPGWLGAANLYEGTHPPPSRFRGLGPTLRRVMLRG